MQVTGKWIKENVGWTSAPFNLKYWIDDLKKYDTNLTKLGIQDVESGYFTKPFAIILPGHGVINAKGKGY